jgi:hypothetical protein
MLRGVKSGSEKAMNPNRVAAGCLALPPGTGDQTLLVELLPNPKLLLTVSPILVVSLWFLGMNARDVQEIPEYSFCLIPVVW